MGDRVTRLQSRELARAKRLKQALASGASPVLIPTESDVSDTGLSWKNHEDAVTRCQYLEQFFQNAPDGFSIVDPAQVVICVNETFQRMFGYTSEEVIGRPLEQCIGAPDHEAEAQWVTECIEQGKKVTLETLRRTKDNAAVD